MPTGAGGLSQNFQHQVRGLGKWRIVMVRAAVGVGGGLVAPQIFLNVDTTVGAQPMMQVSSLPITLASFGDVSFYKDADLANVYIPAPANQSIGGVPLPDLWYYEDANINVSVQSSDPAQLLTFVELFIEF